MHFTIVAILAGFVSFAINGKSTARPFVPPTELSEMSALSVFKDINISNFTIKPICAFAGKDCFSCILIQRKALYVFGESTRWQRLLTCEHFCFIEHFSYSLCIKWIDICRKTKLQHIFISWSLAGISESCDENISSIFPEYTGFRDVYVCTELAFSNILCKFKTGSRGISTIPSGIGRFGSVIRANTDKSQLLNKQSSLDGCDDKQSQGEQSHQTPTRKFPPRFLDLGFDRLCSCYVPDRLDREKYQQQDTLK